MFQYAMGRSLSIRTNSELKFDHSFLEYRNHNTEVTIRNFELDIFDINTVRAADIEIKPFFDKMSFKDDVKKALGLKIPYHVVNETSLNFSSLGVLNAQNLLLNGHWQSFKYFASYENILKQDFTFRYLIQPESLALKEDIVSSDAVCIFIRRTDYLNNNLMALCQMDYYHEAIRIISNKLISPKFFVFSDDQLWTEEHFKQYPSFTLVSAKHDGPRFENKFQLMSLCKHFIIANSTYSWWAAWLSEHENKIVIAPSKWFKKENIKMEDRIPSDWITI